MDKSNKIILLIVVSFIPAGIVDGYFYNRPDIMTASYFIHVLVFAILMLMWLYAHSSENNVRIHRGYTLGIVLLSVVTVPIYFFSKFGFMQGLKKSLLAAGAFSVCMALYLITCAYFQPDVL